MTINNLNKAGIDLIASSETCELHAYPDPGSDLAKECRKARIIVSNAGFIKLQNWRTFNAAPWTCGWGSTGPDIVWNTVWTQEMADKRFQASLNYFSFKLRAITVDLNLNDNQFSALVSFAYNVKHGVSIIDDLIKELHSSPTFYRNLWYHLSQYNKSNGDIFSGLVKRRIKEHDLFFTPMEIS